MLDIFHLQIEEKSIIETIHRYAPINFHVHLADNNRKYPGAGGFDFDSTSARFKKRGMTARLPWRSDRYRTASRRPSARRRRCCRSFSGVTPIGDNAECDRL
jgi:sugar phosphate isomerase/epimerase